MSDVAMSNRCTLLQSSFRIRMHVFNTEISSQPVVGETDYAGFGLRRDQAEAIKLSQIGFAEISKDRLLSLLYRGRVTKFRTDSPIVVAVIIIGEKEERRSSSSIMMNTYLMNK